VRKKSPPITKQDKEWAVMTRRALGVPDIVGEAVAGRAMRGWLQAEFGDSSSATHDEAEGIAMVVLLSVTFMGGSGELDHWLLPAELAVYARREDDDPDARLQEYILSKVNADGHDPIEIANAVSRMAKLLRDQIRTYVNG
jgi:hypothetical protein